MTKIKSRKNTPRNKNTTRKTLARLSVFGLGAALAAVAVRKALPHTGALRLPSRPSRRKVPVKIRFDVLLPESLLETAEVFLTGSITETGAWNPAAVPLERIAPRRARAELEFDGETPLEYKFTLGSWDTGERWRGGIERPNRIFDPEKYESDDVIVTVEIEDFSNYSGRFENLPRMNTNRHE